MDMPRRRKSLKGGPFLELLRFAISSETPPNTASNLLSRMTKHIRRLYPEVIGLISYQDTAKHTGIIYAAGNWIRIYQQKKHLSWGNRKRLNKEQSKAPKVRWVFPLRKKFRATCLSDAPVPAGASREHTRRSLHNKAILATGTNPRRSFQ